MPISKTIDTLTDTDFAMNVGYVAGGWAFAVVLGNVLESMVGIDLPNELYGVVSIAGATYVLTGTDRKYASVGGGIYIADSVAQRLGVKQSVTQLGGGN